MAISKPEGVSDLSLTNTAGVIALGLVVTASPKHLILVSATAPVSAGRSRPRRFVFIGRLGNPDNGVCDLTQMYGPNTAPWPPTTGSSSKPFSTSTAGTAIPVSSPPSYRQPK